MDLIPPTIISKETTVITIPVTHVGTLKVECNAPAIEFPCVMFPIPKEAITANRAKSHARTAPNVLFFRPFFIVYIGPPLISPLAFISRYLIASMHSLNLEVRPNAPETHIHTRAPGPPDTIAVATPTILPVPIVAASAVVSAENGETSPSPRLFVRASLLRVLFSAYPRFLHVRNLVRNVRNIPVPTNRTSITGPQTKSSICAIISFNCSISMFPPLFLYIKVLPTASKKCIFFGNAKRSDAVATSLLLINV